MGMNIAARLIFGAPYTELVYLENLQELIDEDKIDYASPYYGSSPRDWIVGVSLPSWMDDERDLMAAYSAAKAEFEELTGYNDGRWIVSPHVT